MSWSRRGGEALPVPRTSQEITERHACRLISLLQPLDNAQVAHGAVAQRAQRLLVGGAVVGGDGPLDARELGNDDALALARFVGGGGGAAREIAPAEGSNRGARKRGVGGKLVWVGDRTIAGHPIAFRHGGRPCLCCGSIHADERKAA